MGLGLKKPADVPGKSWPAIVIGLFVAFGGVLFGYVRQGPPCSSSLTDIDMTLVLSLASLRTSTGWNIVCLMSIRSHRSDKS